MNKRGIESGGARWWLWLILAVVVIFGIVVFWGDDITNSLKSINWDETTPIGQMLNVAGDNGWGPIATFAGYIFGEVPTMMAESTAGGGVSAVIIIIALWIIIVLMFGDIIANFSSFNRGIAWAIAILIGIIGANLKGLSMIAAGLTGVFTFLGIFAAYAGLFAAFVAFFGVEWGIKSWMPWIMRRKSAQQAVKAQGNTSTILDAVRHYKEVGRELGTD